MGPLEYVVFLTPLIRQRFETRQKRWLFAIATIFSGLSGLKLALFALDVSLVVGVAVSNGPAPDRLPRSNGGKIYGSGYAQKKYFLGTHLATP